MIISDDELDKRLQSPANLSNIIKNNKIEIRDSRKEQSGHTRVPPMLRELMGLISNTGPSDETNKDIGAVFGVTGSAVSNYSKGVLATGEKDKKNNIVKISDRVNEDKSKTARSLALDTVMETLKILKPRISDPEHLAGLKVSELSKIATDMSKIARNMVPDKNEIGSITNNTQVILYKPNQKKESQYDVIDV